MKRQFTSRALEMLIPEWSVVRDRIAREWRLLSRSPAFAPPLLAQQLLVSGEDHRHSRHPGFDVIAIGRAMWRRLSRGTREGASTIEQQIVRVVTGRYERTYRRKMREIVLAVLVAHRFPKAILPAVYLRIGYYGWRMNGYREACLRLGIDCVSLSPHDAAKLVARLKYPQPRQLPHRRELQIDLRARHLCTLYRRHVCTRTYEHLNEKTIRNNPAFRRPIPQS